MWKLMFSMGNLWLSRSNKVSIENMSWSSHFICNMLFKNSWQGEARCWGFVCKAFITLDLIQPQVHPTFFSSHCSSIGTLLLQYFAVIPVQAASSNGLSRVYVLFPTLWPFLGTKLFAEQLRCLLFAVISEIIPLGQPFLFQPLKFPHLSKTIRVKVWPINIDPVS